MDKISRPNDIFAATIAAPDASLAELV